MIGIRLFRRDHLHEGFIRVSGEKRKKLRFGDVGQGIFADDMDESIVPLDSLQKIHDSHNVAIGTPKNLLGLNQCDIILITPCFRKIRGYPYTLVNMNIASATPRVSRDSRADSCWKSL